MKVFEKKRKRRKFIYSKLTILCLMALLFVLIRGTSGVYDKARISVARKNTSSVNLAKLNDRQVSLESEIERLDSRVGLEEELRTRYSFSKEGEKVIVIINNASNTDESVDEGPHFISKATSWLKKITLLE